MADRVLLYAGTRNGLEILNLSEGHSEQIGEAFAGEQIRAVTGNHAGLVFVGIGNGLYRSNDAGLNWNKVLDGDIRSLKVDPTDDQVIYAGTEPVHLYRSEDGGTNWDELSSLQRLPEETHLKLDELEPIEMPNPLPPGFRHRRQDWWAPIAPHNGHILQIYVHPDDPEMILLSVEHGGIALSIDRGQTWEDASGGIDHLDIHFVSCVPNRLDRFVVAASRGLYISSDPRKGWTRSQEGCDRTYYHDIVFAPSTDGGDPAILVTAADGSPGHWRRKASGSRAAIYRSTNCGESWQRVGVGRGLSDEMDPFIWDFCVHPHEANLIFASVGEPSSFVHWDLVAPGAEAAAAREALNERARLNEVGPGSIISSYDGGDSWKTVVTGMPAIGHMFVTTA